MLSNVDVNVVVDDTHTHDHSLITIIVLNLIAQELLLIALSVQHVFSR